jgi:hypothetical protein
MRIRTLIYLFPSNPGKKQWPQLQETSYEDGSGAERELAEAFHLTFDTVTRINGRIRQKITGRMETAM